VDCSYFNDGRCTSCSLLRTPYEQQVADKDARAHALVPAAQWLAPTESAELHFRTKSKLVVGGTTHEPTLGILGQDLSDCRIVDERVLTAYPALKGFIRAARLVPYDVGSRRGELKNILVTVAPGGGLMIRFVLRSTESLLRIRKHLPSLQDALPALHVATVNLLPAHAALVEGEEEIVLTEADALPHGLLQVLPRSFLQTNTAIAESLYAQGKRWVDEANPSTVWDLYCGVGGFGLHVAGDRRTVIGVELSQDAVDSANRAAAQNGADARFVAADATDWARKQDASPDLVIVNPPRRGIGPELAGWLEESGAQTVLYSSCNAESLAKDLELMPSLQPVKAQVFDMFPHTSHFETLVLLARLAG